jgi:hypothetical protein
MAQLKTISWTNPASAVARNQSVGFAVARVTTYDVTAGNAFVWVYGMPNGYYMNVATGAVTTSNGWTPLAQQALFGAPITAVTRAADTVFTCSFLSQFAFAVGDTVKATEIADDATGLTLNRNYTVLSVSATQVTMSDDTAAGYSAYVSGGFLSQVSNVNGIPYPTVNVAIQGGTIGTGMVGGNASAMVAVFEGQMSVV